MTGYAAERARFADWCESRGLAALPAAPGTVLAYLEAERPSGGTAARWVAGIRAAHAAAGLADPCLGSAAAWVRRARAADAAGERELARLAGLLPESGWPSGLRGRRDRLAFLLKALGAVPAAGLAVMRASAVEVTGPRTVLVDVGAGARALVRALGEDRALCPACAAIGWAEVLSLSARFGRIAALLRRPPAPGHRCDSPGAGCEWPAGWPLLPSLDRWGHPVVPPVPGMSARAVEEMLRGCARGTRSYPAERPRRRHSEPARELPPPPPPVFPPDRGWHRAGVAARARDAASMGGVDDLLERLEAAAEGAAERARRVLEAGTAGDED